MIYIYLRFQLLFPAKAILSRLGLEEMLSRVIERVDKDTRLYRTEDRNVVDWMPKSDDAHSKSFIAQTQSILEDIEYLKKREAKEPAEANQKQIVEPIARMFQQKRKIAERCEDEKRIEKKKKISFSPIDESPDSSLVDVFASPSNVSSNTERIESAKKSDLNTADKTATPYRKTLDRFRNTEDDDDDIVGFSPGTSSTAIQPANSLPENMQNVSTEKNDQSRTVKSYGKLDDFFDSDNVDFEL